MPYKYESPVKTPTGETYAMSFCMGAAVSKVGDVNRERLRN